MGAGGIVLIQFFGGHAQGILLHLIAVLLYGHGLGIHRPVHQTVPLVINILWRIYSCYGHIAPFAFHGWIKGPYRSRLGLRQGYIIL